MTTVLIVDDQQLVRAGFALILSTEPDLTVVGEVSDGASAVEAARRLRPDVVLMDVQMPGVDGIAATRAIVESTAAMVVVLTTFDSDDYLFSALEAGASGFLLKNCRPEELVAAVRVVAAGDALLDPSVTHRVIRRLAGGRSPNPGIESGDVASTRGSRSDHVPAPVVTDGLGGIPPTGDTARCEDAAAGLVPDPPGSTTIEPRPSGPGGHLTPREVDVLRLVAQGLSNGEIAATLVVGEATVKTHVSRLLTKLDARDRVQLVVHAHRTGLAPPAG